MSQKATDSLSPFSDVSGTNIYLHMRSSHTLRARLTIFSMLSTSSRISVRYASPTEGMVCSLSRLIEEGGSIRPALSVQANFQKFL